MRLVVVALLLICSPAYAKPLNCRAVQEIALKMGDEVGQMVLVKAGLWRCILPIRKHRLGS